VKDATDIKQQCQLGIFRGVGAGLFNLFATFKMVGEPAPTGLMIVDRTPISTFYSNNCSPIDCYQKAFLGTRAN
jgi:hypothetical protein